MGLGAGEDAVIIFHRAFTYEAWFPITSSCCLHLGDPRGKLLQTSRETGLPGGGGFVHCRSRDMAAVWPWLPYPLTSPLLEGPAVQTPASLMWLSESRPMTVLTCCRGIPTRRTVCRYCKAGIPNYREHTCWRANEGHSYLCLEEILQRWEWVCVSTEKCMECCVLGTIWNVFLTPQWGGYSILLLLQMMGWCIKGSELHTSQGHKGRKLWPYRGTQGTWLQSVTITQCPHVEATRAYTAGPHCKEFSSCTNQSGRQI